MTELASAVTSLISMIGNVVSALFTSEGAFAPLLAYFVIGVAVSVILLSIKGIKSVVWGA